MPRPFRSLATPLLAAVLFLIPTSGYAQGKWGISFSHTPNWIIAPMFTEGDDDEGGGTKDTHVTGKEFTIGFVHGKSRGGDWGVSFMHKPFNNSSGSTEQRQDCFGNPVVCRTETKVTTFHDVRIDGIEAHWQPMFVTIKGVAQIGINLAGGIGIVKGTIVEVTDGIEPVFSNAPPFPPPTFVAFHEEETKQANEELPKNFPLFKVEVVGGVILGPHLKIKVAYGVNFPSFKSARVEGVVLF